VTCEGQKEMKRKLKTENKSGEELGKRSGIEREGRE
tara:strand:+ start:791 stop:898 length:108 start_codon:yes stop_codon:yes gene_type:complete